MAPTPAVTKWLRSVIEALLFAGDEHPRVIVPSFTFDNAFVIASKISPGAAVNASIVDFTSVMPSLDEITKTATEQFGLNIELPDEKWWALEYHSAENRNVKALGPYTWPVVSVTPKEVGVLRECTGYLSPTAGWSPRFMQMTEMGIPVVSPWRIFSKVIGNGFEELASTIETMSNKERAALAELQHAQLVKFTPSKTKVATQINKLMDAPELASKPIKPRPSSPARLKRVK